MARRNVPEGFGRLAAVLASSDEAAPRIESRLDRLAVTTRWVTISAGILVGVLRHSRDHFVAATIVLVAFAVIQTFQQAQPRPSTRMRVMVLVELLVTVSVGMANGRARQPVRVDAGHGPPSRRLRLGPARHDRYRDLRRDRRGRDDPDAVGGPDRPAVGRSDRRRVPPLRSTGRVHSRNLISDIESHRAAAIDQAAEMATANELLVSLHALAQTLPASFDLPEVVDSMRLRLRSLVHFSVLVVLVRDDAQSVWNVELAEGVRLPARLLDRELPQPLQRALTSTHPVIIEDRLLSPEEDGFAALGRSGLYTALRARGALVGLIALEDVTANSFGAEQLDLIENLSSLLALSIDNARWFGRLRTLGAEAERARIARELHDRVAQSLAYVAFELERMHALPGDKDGEIAELRVVVRDIVRELRQTIYQLRANVSEDADIVEVASGYLERFADRTGIHTQWLPQASAALPYRIEQELWRIGQEALVNIERHSGATEVTVHWDVHDGRPGSRSSTTASASISTRSPESTTGSSGCENARMRSARSLRSRAAPTGGTRIIVELMLTPQSASGERRTA